MNNQFRCLYLLEVEIFEGEMNLHNAGGLDTGAQDILLGWLVILGA